MVLFSTVIPVFNRASLIKKTLESVFNQASLDQEIILVDDGSTDKTLEVLEEYGDRIKVLHQDNKGPGEARNLGIRHAQGQYIVFLDSDDLWFPWTLATLEQVIKEHNFPSFVAGNSVYFQNDLELSSVQLQPSTSECFTDYYAAAKCDLPFLTSAVAVKRAVLQEVGGFTAQWINGEDNDLWLRLGVVDKFVYVHAPVILGYRRHPTSAISDMTKTYQGACYIIEQEQKGVYPGRQERLNQRLEILSRHIRPVSLTCLKQKQFARALYLYQKTFLWNYKLKRFRYLTAFPILFLMASGKNFFSISLSKP